MKKILIISSYSPPAIGGPQNLYNLLRDFPVDRYNILTSFYNIDNLSALKGSWLSGNYFFYDKTSATKEDRIKAAQENQKEEKKSSLLLTLKNLARRNWFIRNLVGIPVIFSQIFWIVTSGKTVISKTCTDIMIGFSDYGPAIISTYLLHKITGKPYIIFLFDLYKSNFYPFPGGILASIFEKRIFKYAEKIIVTNQGTKDFYFKRYGATIADRMTIIHNAAFPEGYLKLITPYQPKPPYKILFTGRIYWPQIGALQNLVKAVNQLNDIDIKLDIYCPNLKSYLASIGIIESDKIKISVAPPEQMPEIQSNTDILFLPLSWNTKSQTIIDTATPGKFTDYLIAGRPMLIHAPATTYLVKYAKENNVAMIVDDNDVEKLKNAIKKLLIDIGFSRQLMENARELFFKNHDASKNAKIFHSLFQ